MLALHPGLARSQVPAPPPVGSLVQVIPGPEAGREAEPPEDRPVQGGETAGPGKRGASGEAAGIGKRPEKQGLSQGAAPEEVRGAPPAVPERSAPGSAALLARASAGPAPRRGGGPGPGEHAPSSEPAQASGAAVQEADVPPEQEMSELRRFEEQAFPKPGPKVVLPGDVSGLEGLVPERKSPRPGAENPPAALRSEGQTAPAGGEAGAEPGSAETDPESAPAPWLTRLRLPDLPVKWTPRVIRYLEFYRDNPRGRSIMRHWLQRQGRYQKLIDAALLQHGLPRSLILVAMIESGFAPGCTSRVGAAGLWQFMPRPGRGYGLSRDYWFDERRNPDKSTEAALQFLKDLHARLGTWELALAAYNAGYYGVQRAMQKYNTNDYWTLSEYEAGLPWSTVLYVPKIMAAAVVNENREYFGFGEVKPDPELAHELVAVTASVTVEQAARAAGIRTGEFELLNPELRRGRTPPGVRTWLRVPPGAGKRFYAGLAQLRDELARYRPYLVRLGETERTIAEAFGLSRRALRSLNGLASAEELRPGLTLLVPNREPRAAEVAGKKPSAGGPAGGDYASSDDEALLVPLPPGVPQKVEGKVRVFYRAVPGDTLDEVASNLEVPRSDLAAWNRLDTQAALAPEMVLQAFVSKDYDQSRAVLLPEDQLLLMVAGSEDFLNRYEQRKGRRRVVYSAREGDTLAAIARRVGLTEGDLMRINKVSRTVKLDAGQKLTVYLEKGKALPGAKKRKKGKGKGKGLKAASETKKNAEVITPAGPAAEEPEGPPAPASAAPAQGESKAASKGPAEASAPALPAQTEGGSKAETGKKGSAKVRRARKKSAVNGRP